MDKIFVMDKKYFVIDKIILSRTNLILSRTKNIFSGQMDRALEFKCLTNSKQQEARPHSTKCCWCYFFFVSIVILYGVSFLIFTMCFSGLFRKILLLYDTRYRLTYIFKNALESGLSIIFFFQLQIYVDVGTSINLVWNCNSFSS